jgi:hypothetical protein
MLLNVYRRVSEATEINYSYIFWYTLYFLLVDRLDALTNWPHCPFAKFEIHPVET